MRSWEAPSDPTRCSLSVALQHPRQEILECRLSWSTGKQELGPAMSCSRPTIVASSASHRWMSLPTGDDSEISALNITKANKPSTAPTWHAIFMLNAIKPKVT